MEQPPKPKTEPKPEPKPKKERKKKYTKPEFNLTIQKKDIMVMFN